MIVRISGKLVEQKPNALIIDVQGLSHEVLVPASVIHRVQEYVDAQGMISLLTYYYIQIGPSKGVPCMIGFFTEIERDFFMDFITVSGIGPRAAVKALNRPISEIAGAIAKADLKFLKTLPGIGMQKAKEVVAKLQGRIGKYALIQDQGFTPEPAAPQEAEMTDWQQEAMDVLLQLQYKRSEAQQMIARALQRSANMTTAEELLNEIYKQRTHG